MQANARAEVGDRVVTAEPVSLCLVHSFHIFDFETKSVLSVTDVRYLQLGNVSKLWFVEFLFPSPSSICS